tara:strand:- start:1944 stop:2246 length:303 start_codon:yes stop_codon:yes gene_type:complete
MPSLDKIHLYDKIFSPLLTEKSTNLSGQNKIVFKVHKNANKINLKNNIEKIFKVNVVKINIINKQNRLKLTRGRKVKVSGFKKAIITLKKGQSIDLTTGI